MIEDGFHALGADRLATLVTWMSRPLPEAQDKVNLPEGVQLCRLTSIDCPRYIELFRAVGARWMWFSRLRLPQDELAAILDDPAVSAFAMQRDGRDIGLLEMDYRDASVPELSFLGLVQEEIGRGYGRLLMELALNHARAQNFKSLHLHSCTFDHPGALAFYSAMGFTVTRREVEVFIDPRIDGTLAPDAVAGLPLEKTGVVSSRN